MGPKQSTHSGLGERGIGAAALAEAADGSGDREAAMSGEECVLATARCDQLGDVKMA